MSTTQHNEAACVAARRAPGGKLARNKGSGCGGGSLAIDAADKRGAATLWRPVSARHHLGPRPGGSTLEGLIGFDLVATNTGLAMLRLPARLEREREFALSAGPRPSWPLCNLPHCPRCNTHSLNLPSPVGTHSGVVTEQHGVRDAKPDILGHHGSSLSKRHR